MKSVPDAQLLNPLAVSGLLSACLMAGTGLLVPEVDDPATASLLERMVGNSFILAIGFVGFWSLIYGLLQVAAARGENGTGFGAWLTGTAETGRPVPSSSDRSLEVAFFADRWGHVASRRLAPLNYAVWVLPLLGFIGTVVGISEAIGELGNVFADGDRQQALQSVLGGLRFAFDTTFAGLVLVIPVMALSSWIRLTSDAARDRALAAHYGGRE